MEGLAWVHKRGRSYAEFTAAHCAPSPISLFVKFPAGHFAARDVLRGRGHQVNVGEKSQSHIQGIPCCG